MSPVSLSAISHHVVGRQEECTHLPNNCRFAVSQPLKAPHQQLVLISAQTDRQAYSKIQLSDILLLLLLLLLCVWEKPTEAAAPCALLSLALARGGCSYFAVFANSSGTSLVRMFVVAHSLFVVFSKWDPDCVLLLLLIVGRRLLLLLCVLRG